MVPSHRTYTEYNLDNILDMSPEQFAALLNDEIYSLVLIFRLLELMDNFEDIEEYEYCIPIRDFFDYNNINFNKDKDNDDE